MSSYLPAIMYLLGDELMGVDIDRVRLNYQRPKKRAFLRYLTRTVTSCTSSSPKYNGTITSSATTPLPPRLGDVDNIGDVNDRVWGWFEDAEYEMVTDSESEESFTDPLFDHDGSLLETYSFPRALHYHEDEDNNEVNGPHLQKHDTGSGRGSMSGIQGEQQCEHGMGHGHDDDDDDDWEVVPVPSDGDENTDGSRPIERRKATRFDLRDQSEYIEDDIDLIQNLDLVQISCYKSITTKPNPFTMAGSLSLPLTPEELMDPANEHIFFGRLSDILACIGRASKGFLGPPPLATDPERGPSRSSSPVRLLGQPYEPGERHCCIHGITDDEDCGYHCEYEDNIPARAEARGHPADPWEGISRNRPPVSSTTGTIPDDALEGTSVCRIRSCRHFGGTERTWVPTQISLRSPSPPSHTRCCVTGCLPPGTCGVPLVSNLCEPEEWVIADDEPSEPLVEESHRPTRLLVTTPIEKIYQPPPFDDVPVEAEDST
ncbi:hypothetical protein F5Y15DRAFT_423845 [Xylariaceae sp. FL0016]|nr:hypothetical protein F5Y15DRAFT_423845 [Xylariaceae sp. FL0016]